MKTKGTYIDLRNEAEREEFGYLDFAIHIPLYEIPEKIEQIKQMTPPITLFCQSGNRAERAIEYLNEQSISQLINGGGYANIVQSAGKDNRAE